MSAKAISTVLLMSLVFTCGWSSLEAAPAEKGTVFSLPTSESTSDAPKFSDAQLAYVQSWIKQKAPECPVAISGAVAEGFLEELQQRQPEKLDQLLKANFSLGAFESMLLRHVAVKLTGAAQTPVREEIARRRVTALLVAEAGPSRTDAAGLMEKIKDGSQAQYRRLVDGRMDDDDLHLLLKKAGQAGAAPREVAPVKPKVLTVSDILAEYSRHNQVGSAMQRLQAYGVEGRLKTMAGDEQDLLLFKMRPARFRLVIRSAGKTSYILAGDRDRYWQQSPGQAPQVVTVQAMGQRRYLAEFADPLFNGENYAYERLADGLAEGKKIHRIAVRRPDGSGYVAGIDAESFREISRENEDHTTVRYSDFREVAGVIYAFQEEITDQAGHKGVLNLTRISSNPGLIQDFFEPPLHPELGYFELERYLAPATQAVAKFN